MGDFQQSHGRGIDHCTPQNIMPKMTPGTSEWPESFTRWAEKYCGGFCSYNFTFMTSHPICYSFNINR